MKNFTKLFLSAALFCGVTTVSAQDEGTDLTAEMFQTWQGFDENAIPTGAADVEFNLGVELEGGNVVCGTGSVFNTVYADLTGSTKLLFEGTSGLVLRVMFNRQSDNSLIEKNPKMGDDGKAELDLTDLSYVHLNTIKINWGANGSVTSIKFVKPSDPLELPKEALKKVIAKAKMYKAVGKTETSFAVLTSAIADAEAALAAEDATEESLTKASDDLKAAIDGLKLADGYVELTADMFKRYASVEEPGEGSATGCAYEMFVASGLPYGDSNVGELNWADLTSYEKLIVTTSGDIKPRFCLNRLVKDGQQAETQEDSKMLDINPNNANTWSTEKYETIEDNVYTIDLTKIVADYEFARLHCIKKQGWGDGVVVTDMLLYSNPETVAIQSVTVAKENNAVYDLQGRRVAQPTKGLYIVNGKKVVIK